MRAFACENCRGLLFFDNDECLTCTSQLGYDRELATLVVIGHDKGVITIDLAEGHEPAPRGPAGGPGSATCSATSAPTTARR